MSSTPTATLSATTEDRLELTRMVSTLGRALDLGRYDAFRELFTTAASIRTPGGEQQGIDRIIGQASASHDDYDVTQHLFGDVLTEIDDDRARVSANAIATLVPDSGHPETHRTLGTRYEFDAIRSDAGWRFERMAITPLWSRG